MPYPFSQNATENKAIFNLWVENIALWESNEIKSKMLKKVSKSEREEPYALSLFTKC
jgi:hypothetical protein